jgi:iron complex transport system substrate-binding protein
MKTIIKILTAIVILISNHALSAEKRTIKDMAGRNVTIPAEIKRIVAISASLRYIVYMQCFDRVVAVEGIEKQNLMKGINSSGKAYWLAISHKLSKIPTIGEGGPGKIPDFERLISIKPDVIFTFEADNANLIEQKTGIPCIVLAYAGTAGFNIEEVKKTFSFLGEILNKKERANELNRYIDLSISDLNKRTKDEKPQSVYIGGISARGAHGITSTEAYYPSLQWINVHNVADEAGQRGHIFIDKERLILWNPQHIFIDAAGLSLIESDYQKNPEFYKKLSAFGNSKTLFPYNFYRTNLEILILNSYFIGKSIYPHKFKDINTKDKAAEIFIKFLGKDIYHEIKQSYKGYGKVKFTSSGISVE